QGARAPGVLHCVEVGEVTVGVFGEFGSLLEDRQFIADPVNVQGLQLLLGLWNCGHTGQRDPAVVFHAGLILDVDAGDVFAVSLPQTANWLLAPVQYLLILGGRMRFANGTGWLTAIGSIGLHTVTVSQLVSQCQVGSETTSQTSM